MFNSKSKPQSNTANISSQPISTVVGTEILFKGDISGTSTIKVDGNVEGNINVKSGVILGEKGKVIGNIDSNQVVIYGTLQGNISCKELILKSSGIINGDISTQALEIEQGGKYNGKLSMSNASVSETSAKANL